MSTTINLYCSYEGDVQNVVALGETWSYIHSNSPATDLSSIPLGVYIRSANSTNKWITIHRGIHIYDFSSLAGKDITEAKFHAYGLEKTNFFDSSSFALCLVEATTLSNTEVSKSDFNGLGTTILAPAIAYNDWYEDQWHTFTFNADGIAALNRGVNSGYFKLGFREYNYDLPNITPTWEQLKTAYIQWDTYISVLPYLEITYNDAPTTESRVTTIRHTYRSGFNLKYQATLGFGSLISLPDYNDNLDNLKEEMKTEAIKQAIDETKQQIQSNKTDLLINRPATDMGVLPPNIQNIWKTEQNRRGDEQLKKTAGEIWNILNNILGNKK